MNDMPDFRTSITRNVLLSLILSALMVLVSGSILILAQYGEDNSQVFRNTSFEDAKSALRDQPDDQNLQWSVRELDRRLRNDYIYSRQLSDNCRYLFVIAVIALIISARYYITLKTVPVIPEQDDCKCKDQRLRLYSTYGMLFFTGCFAIMLVGYLGSVLFNNDKNISYEQLAGELSENIDKPAIEGTEVASFIPIETLSQSWYRFRGFGGMGAVSSEDIVLEFDLETGENIRWNVETELSGFNSPVIFDNKIFYSGANELVRKVYCHDLSDGKLLWDAKVEVPERASQDVPDVMEDTGFAAPTMATDGIYVYSIFANGDAACHDFSGKQIWVKNFGLPESTYGYAASLDVWQGNVLIQFDHGYDDQESISELISIEGKTGDIKWRHKRPVINSWTSPIIANTGGKWQYITVSNPWVISYDPSTGDELWRCDGMSGDTAPSPIVAKDLVFVISPFDSIRAVQTSLSGDISQTGVLWSVHDGIPDTTTPVSDGEKIWFFTSDGTLTCYNVEDGNNIYEHSIDGFYYSSPSLVNDKLLFCSMEGKYIVLNAGQELETVFEADFGEKICSSPSFGNDYMIVRTDTRLFCIGK